MKLLLLLIPTLSWSYVEPTVVKTSFTTVAVISSGTFIVTLSSGSQLNPFFFVSTGISVAQLGTWYSNRDAITSSDSYTGTGNGSTINVSTHPTINYGLLVYQNSGTAVSWDIRCEGSLDNINFSQIVQHTNTNGTGATVWSGASMAIARFFRTRTAGISLGTAQSLTAVCMGSN